MSADAAVLVHGRRVGTLAHEKGGTSFRYFVDPGNELLGQTFEGDPHAVRRSRTTVPAWFANLLPEGESRRRVVREMGGGRVNDYRLLLRLGADLPGAVTVESTEAEDGRFSLAGVQLKYSVHRPDGWWIVKRRTPQLAPVYDFHSLTVYRTYRYSRLALSLGGEQMPNLVGVDQFRVLAERDGSTLETIDALRSAWYGEIAAEARRLDPALAEHYAQRLVTLPLVRG